MPYRNMDGWQFALSQMGKGPLYVLLVLRQNDHIARQYIYGARHTTMDEF
jgi:hypothetical protein